MQLCLDNSKPGWRVVELHSDNGFHNTLINIGWVGDVQE